MKKQTEESEQRTVMLRRARNPYQFIHDIIFILRMQCVQQRACNQVLRPNHTGGPDQEPTTHSRETETRKLGSEYEGQCEPISEFDIIELFGYDDGVESIRTADSDICHDEHEDVFLDIPWTWIERNLKGSLDGQRTDEVSEEEFDPR